MGKTTVGRILKEQPVSPPTPATLNATPDEEESPKRIVIANYPNHVWGLDLTTVPLFGGLWTSWFPNAFPQCWPFCWWLALVVDHHSRRPMGFRIFRKQPSSRAVQKFLDRTIQKNDAKPKYIVTDKGRQFWCDGFKGWCKVKKITPRFGAVGKYGSIAVVERCKRRVAALILASGCGRCLADTAELPRRWLWAKALSQLLGSFAFLRAAFRKSAASCWTRGTGFRARPMARQPSLETITGHNDPDRP